MAMFPYFSCSLFHWFCCNPNSSRIPSTHLESALVLINSVFQSTMKDLVPSYL
uniref:Uncharacterized protein n=1 Tax=Solanum tuberosum TaxID=4113 RepID=M0ZXX4_SOLTU